MNHAIAEISLKPQLGIIEHHQTPTNKDDECGANNRIGKKDTRQIGANRPENNDEAEKGEEGFNDAHTHLQTCARKTCGVLGNPLVWVINFTPGLIVRVDEVVGPIRHVALQQPLTEPLAP